MYIYGDFIGNIIYEVLMEKSLNYINELRFPAGRVWLPKGTHGWERVTHGFFWPLLKRNGHTSRIIQTHPIGWLWWLEQMSCRKFPEFCCSRGNDCLQADHKFSDTRSLSSATNIAENCGNIFNAQTYTTNIQLSTNMTCPKLVCETYSA